MSSQARRSPRLSSRSASLSTAASLSTSTTTDPIIANDNGAAVAAPHYVQLPPAAVRWAHAVNSQQALQAALAAGITMLEIDVILGDVDGVLQPLLAHPPATTSDLSLAALLRTLSTVAPHAAVGLKLDFKQPAAVEPSLQLLKQVHWPSATRLWLNADVFQGPGNLFLALFCYSLVTFTFLNLNSSGPDRWQTAGVQGSGFCGHVHHGLPRGCTVAGLDHGKVYSASRLCLH